MKKNDDYKKKTKTQEAKDLLFKIIIAHVPVRENKFYKFKAILFAIFHSL